MGRVLSSVSVLESNELLRECWEETKDILQLRSLEEGFVASTGSAVCTTTGSTGVALFCSVLVAGESGTMVTGTAILGLKYFRFAEDAGRAICLGWLLLKRWPDRSLMLGGDSELL